MGDEPTPNDRGEPADDAVHGAQRRRLKLIGAFLLLGAVVLAIIIVLVVRLMRGAPAGPDPMIYEEGHNPFLEAQGTSCIGMPLGSGTVVYSIDSSSALQGSFDAIRSAVGRSLGTLNTRQRFGLVIWSEGSPRVLALSSNTPAGRSAATDVLDETQPTGSTDAAAGIREAIKLGSETVCIIASKGPAQEDVAGLAQAIRRKGIVLRCLAIRDPAPTLRALAEQTGGSFQLIDPQDLKLWLTESQ